MLLNYGSILASQGANVSIHSLNPVENNFDYTDYSDIHFSCVGKRNKISVLLHTIKRISVTHPDFVLVSHVRVSVMMCAIKLVLRNFKLITRVENRFTFQKKYIRYGIIFKLLRKWAYRATDIIICQTQTMRMELCQEMPRLASKNVVIYNWPSGKSFRIKRGVSNRPFTIGFVGRLSSQKNFQLTLEAFRYFSKISVNTRLIVCGDGPELPHFLVECEQEIKEGRIVFLGYVSDISDEYRNLDCLVITSRYEGLPNVMLEALANGVPVVSVDASGEERRYINEGVSGFVCKPDYQSISFALNSCRENRLSGPWDYYAKLSQEDYKYAKNKLQHILEGR